MTWFNPNKTEEKNLIRNIVFGLEDSLVSTVGLLSGIAVVHMDRQDILVTGFVLIAVEAFSMGVGSLLSENSVEEFEAHGDVSLSASLPGALTMIVFYILGGAVPLIPYLVVDGFSALWWSVAASLLALALLGLVSALVLKINWWKQAFRMAALGGLAIAIGVVVSQIFYI